MNTDFSDLCSKVFEILIEKEGEKEERKEEVLLLFQVLLFRQSEYYSIRNGC